MNVTSHDIQSEIIAALPEILDETTIEMEIVPQLQQLISLAPELTTVILDTLTNFKFAPQLPNRVRHHIFSLQPTTFASFQTQVSLFPLAIPSRFQSL